MMTRKLAALMCAVLGLIVLQSHSVSTPAAAAQLCTDGQSMDGRPSCTCRPPLKYLPGNICGSGKAKPATSTSTEKGVRAICEIGMVPEASGCKCEAPLKVLPGGRCGIPTAAGAKCREGDSQKATRCRCEAPLMLSINRHCIRCLPGDGDRIVNGRCHQNIKRK